MKQPRTNAYAYELERRVLFGVGGLLLVIALLYIYFLAFSIAHVTLREELVRKTAGLAEEVALLEKEYLVRSNGITENEAFAFGLVRAENRLFIEKRTLTFRTGQ